MPPYCPSRDHWEAKPPADLGLDPVKYSPKNGTSK
jgi:hypothetical protein